MGAAAAVVVLVVVSLASLDRPDVPAAPVDTAPTLPSTATPTTSPATTSVSDTILSEDPDFPPLTTTFVSPRNGFSVSYSESSDGTITPATQLWMFSSSVADGFDVIDTGLGAVFKASSADISTVAPDGLYIDQRIDDFLAGDVVVFEGCGVPRSQQVEIVVDGQEGRVAECPNHIEATVVLGGRLYVFTLTHDRRDARAVFDTFIATVDLTPETAVEFPAMATRFVSPTYGYSFDYHDRGGLETATEVWDAASQVPLAILGWDPRVDGVETGFGAYFEAASTEIPDDVSIDEWVDTLVTPVASGGCGVPRSEQEEIVIDGQPGRKAECGHSEATVVADGRLYLFIGPNDDRDWFEAWIATIDLTPETAVS